MKRNTSWVIAVLLALAFSGAALAKLTAQPMMVAEFTLFGYPLRLMYVIGALELICAGLVLWPRFSTIGAGIISCIMIGALFSHLTHGQAAYAPPVVLLLALALTLIWLRNGRIGVPRGIAGVNACA
jgi:putative oxidoreductase